MANDNVGRVLPSAITQLRLCYALRGSGRCTVDRAYKSSTATSIWAYDGENDGVHQQPVDWSTAISDEQKQKSLEICNPSEIEVVLLPLDNCIITGSTYTEGGVADCLLLTDQEFCLVEFKTNAYTQSYLSERLEDGSSQLWNTYERVLCPCCAKKDVKIDQKVAEITFQIVLNETLEVTADSATLLAIESIFIGEHNFPLFVSRQKTF